MAAMKKFFAYKMNTECGIPWVGLEGTMEDWHEVRIRAEALGNKMLPDFARRWLTVLLPVLDKFVETAQGQPDPVFWQSICKEYSEPWDSSYSTSVSGWISLLYPYLASGVNPHLKPWWELWSADGPDTTEFPPTMLSSVPVLWEYNNSEFPMHFHAGVIGTELDVITGALRPLTAWFVTHDPPSDPIQMLPMLEHELVEIHRGADPDDWHAQREIKRLQKDIQKITDSAGAVC
jgi:hypothetical protein